MWGKSSMTLFSVISMTVWPRSSSGVASMNSCTEMSPCEREKRSMGSMLMKRRYSAGRVALPRAAIMRHSRSSSGTRFSARGSATLPAEYLRFINMEPIDLFSRSHGDISVQEFIDATPEELRGQTVMEITENSVIDDFPHMRHVVDRLRDQGFRIAIDDAGAGYSGLQTMVEIEPDFIKLDMSLTRHLDTSVVKQKLVGTLRDFCRQADIALVAEGIETLAQLDALLALGITYGQGFLFAHPGSPYPLRQTILPGGAPAATAPRPKSPPSSESDSAHKPGDSDTCPHACL